MQALCALSQSIPRMTSMVVTLRTMSDAGNTNPPISIWLFWAIIEVSQLDPGELTTIGGYMFSNGKSYLRANASDMKECDAPESNRTEAGTELTGRVPITIVGSFLAFSASTWLAWPCTK